MVFVLVIASWLVVGGPGGRAHLRSIAAVSIGSHDLAVGNLFGSNGFGLFAVWSVRP